MKIKRPPMTTDQREKAEREANDFTAELISTSGTPAQRMMIAAAAERMGLVKKGEQAIVDGRISSEVAHRLVGRAIDHAEKAGTLRHHEGNRKQRRKMRAQERRGIRTATAAQTQIVMRSAR